MTTLTLWAPGRSLPASPIDQSTPKKEADRSAPKKGSSEIEHSALKMRPLQATLLQDQESLQHPCILASKPTPPEPLSILSNSCQIPDLEIVEISSPQAWAQALHEIESAGICGLDLETTGLDPLSSRARLCQLSLPSGRVYVADLWELGRDGAAPLQDLASVCERSRHKKGRP